MKSYIKGLGDFDAEDFVLQEQSGGIFRAHTGEVSRIYSTKDGKVDFIEYGEETLAYVHSAMGYPAIYPVTDPVYRPKARAILMDLDGTTVRSETFWIWIIQQTTASLLGNPGFSLEDADMPHVSGHSVSEHLQYCLDKYCPEKTVEEARSVYFRLTREAMQDIMAGRGRRDAFVPSPGVKDFLLAVKDRGIRIGLVTSGLYEKAWPEILSAFHTMNMGDPAAFYDAIITAGSALGQGTPGTLGELSPKPHPWLYAETARVGLGITETDKCHVLALEDSAAGVVSVRLAGFTCIGLEGGNIRQSGAASLCRVVDSNFEQVLRQIDQGFAE